MSSENPTNHEPAINGVPHAAADPGLPVVRPPSGRFIAQLFVVPGLIVFVLVLIWTAGHYLVAEKRSPDYFIRNLDSSNEDIRWRAASDLAQVLKRPESIDLASDPKFALDLADRLQSALVELDLREKELLHPSNKLPLSDEEKAKLIAKLKPQRNYVLFLISSLGDFTVPVGAPLLCEVATREGPAKEMALRQRRAVWALANLGDKLKKFDDLPEDKKQKIIATLQEEQARPGLRGEWAKTAYRYLVEKKPLGVDAALEKCADADDPSLRRLTAHALNFWDGPRVIPTLEKLAADDGHGTIIDIGEDE